MAGQDPFYLVKDDIQTSVCTCVNNSCVDSASAAIRLMLQCEQCARVSGDIAMLGRKLRHLQLHIKSSSVLQLDKAQEAFIAWQNAGKGSSERRRLQPEIEEECKSIAWQVRRLRSCMLQRANELMFAVL